MDASPERLKKDTDFLMKFVVTTGVILAVVTVFILANIFILFSG